MYLNHYNLTLKPFEISPDPRFLWLGEKHNEALAAMKYGILDNKGFICLTGDVGTGKTTLVNALISSSENNIIFAKFSDPPLDKLDFFNLAADAFGMNQKFSTKGDFISHLRRFLNNAYDHNQEVVLVIEEAQRFDQEQLEEVRLISNIERPDKKLISIIFVGQNEFDGILNKNKPLRQRVSIIHKIKPLQEIETKQYILHRLKIAGSQSEIFSPGAFREIYSFTEGNPRLINIICDLALLTGYAENKKIIEPETIRECALNRLLPTQQKEAVAEYVKASSIPTKETKKRFHPDTLEDPPQILAKDVPPKPSRFKLTYVTSISIVFLLSFVGYLYFYGDNHAPYRNFKTSLGQTFGRYIGSNLETSSQKPDEIATQQSNIAGTETQALDFAAQKASFENQIDQLKSRNEALATDLAELNGAKDRIAELKGVAASREQALFEAAQKITELTNALDQEKKGQDLLRAELSTNADQVAEVQQKLESSQSNAIKFQEEIERYKKDIAALQGQLSDLHTQKTSADTQLDQLKSRNEALTAELADLKGAKERVAELEQLRSSYEELSADIQELRGVEERVAALQAELATKDQVLSQAEQKVADLASALDQEKTSRENFDSERSLNADRVAELQEKLDAALSSRTALEKDVETSSKEIAVLQEQLLDVSAQKDAYENQLEQQKSSYEELSADIQQLRTVEERLTALEGKLTTKDQALSQSEQKVTELTSALDREKKSGELLSSELSQKNNLIIEFQQKLQTSETNQQALEKTIIKSIKEIAALQSEIEKGKAQEAPTESSPKVVDVKKELPSQSEASTDQSEPPSPNDVMDWLFKKKAQ